MVPPLLRPPLAEGEVRRDYFFAKIPPLNRRRTLKHIFTQ